MTEKYQPTSQAVYDQQGVQDQLDPAVQRSVAVRGAIEIACADDLMQLTTANLGKIQERYVKQAESAFRQTVVSTQGKLALRQMTESPTYEQDQLERAAGAAARFAEENLSDATEAAREQALQGLATSIYGNIMDTCGIAPGVTDIDTLTAAIGSIRASFGKIAEDGRPRGGLDRAELKQRLDAAGIPNNIRVLSDEEQTAIQRKKAMERQAQELDLPVEKYEALLNQANTAYNTFVQLGPFYGKDEPGLPPTFRIAAEPIRIPETYKDQLQQTGYDLFALGRALSLLPDRYKEILGADIFYGVPIAWRVDSIMDADGNLRINEIQIDDGAEALMIGEQMAYGLQTVNDSTAAYISDAIQQRTKPVKGLVPYRLARIMQDVDADPYTPNARRFQTFLDTVSKGQVTIEPINRSQLDSIDWDLYSGVFSSAYIKPSEYSAARVPDEKLLAAGECTAMGNKGVFALVYNDELQDFWRETIGDEALARLQQLLIPSSLVNTAEDITAAREAGKVVKIFDSPGKLSLLDTGKGVAGPWSQASEWQTIEKSLTTGASVISQDFVKPARINTLVRANGGNNLESMEGYNRFCFKYVVQNPLVNESPVALTAIEVTIGSNVKPSSRDCAFIPGVVTTNDYVMINL